MGILHHPCTNDHLCPACQSANRASTWDKDKNKGRRQVRWCADCGFGWQCPLPAPEAIDEYYKSVPPYIIHGANEKEEGFRRRIDMLGKLAPKRGKLIDIGSGLGHFLNMARNDGWEVLGIETQQSAAEYCRITFGIDVFTGTIQELDSKQGTYDALTLWDVLEHVYHPLTFLQNCINLLKPGGVLVIAVPNASGWPAKIFKNRWRYVMFTHLNYFTRPYIRKILSRYGLIVQAEKHTLKVQSLLQGALSGLPFEIDTEHLLRAGRQGSIEKGRKEQLRSQASTENAKMISGVLSRARRLALAFNLVPQPFPSGDLMDLYCRKI